MRRTQEVAPMAPLRSRRQSCSWKKTIKQLKSWSWRLANLFCQGSVHQIPRQPGWWFGTFFVFHNIWDTVILRIDYYFSRWLKPPTSNK